MKRLSILLGSLLVVGAISYAKEAVVAPVIVEESKEVIVAPVIVEEEPGFRPSGYVDLQYKYYGKTENHGNLGIHDWNGDGNNRSRMQLIGSIKFTEKQTLQYRVRNFKSLDREDKQGGTTKGTQTRLRYFYDHGNLGDSKIDFTSRIQYISGTSNTQSVEYMPRFDFAKYLPENITSFVFAPKYGYEWSSSNDSNYHNYVGADLYTWTELPFGFEFEFNMYATQKYYGRDQAYGGNYPTKDVTNAIKEAHGAKIKDKNFTLDVEAYLYNTVNLYKDNLWTLDFNFEGGFDPYTFSKNKIFGYDYTTGGAEWRNVNDDQGYSLYMLPNVTLKYKVTDNLGVYVGAGADYRNWDHVSRKSASHWRWQPQAWAGMKATF